MNLVVLSRFPDHNAYGAESSLFRVCEGLARRGHNITLMYNQPGDLLPEYRKFCFHTQPIHTLSVYGRARMVTATPSIVRDALRLPHVPYDLVYGNQYPYIWAGALIGALRGIPMVSHHRDGLPPAKLSPVWSFLFNRVAMNIFVSNATRKAWVDTGMIAPERAMVVHNGIPEEVYFPVEDFASLRESMGVSRDERVVLYVGRLVRRKGIETLLEAFAKMLHLGKRAQLWLAGGTESDDPRYLRALEHKCTQLGISTHVKFLGFQNDVIPFYQLSDQVVLPSVEDESFGKTVAEAMACGTPALGSRIGGIPEVLSGPFEKFLFEPGSSAQLSERLAEGLNWRSEQPALAQMCRDHVVNKFSIERTLDGIEAAFRAAVRNRR